jgi:hypothetical protein
MDMAGTVTGTYRYPVKSMAGETLASVWLGARGVPGDRAWAVRDEVRGGIRGAKRFPELMRCKASYPAPPPDDGSVPARVELPDGREFAIDDAQAAAALGELLGNPVSIWPLMPAEMLDHYRRGAPVLEDFEAELRRVFARNEDEPLPDLGAFPAEILEYESPPGTYFDVFPLLLLSVQSLATLAARAPEHAFDVRRFRPNLLVEAASAAPFPELDWIGRRLRVGAAEVEVTMACPRCVMTTHAFEDLPRDPGIMRALVEQAGGDLGVYATVSTPGEVRVGDRIEVLP